jgi:hypothetical protein
MAHTPEPTAVIHRANAAGLADGSLARIESPWGSATLRLRHEPGMARGTVFAPMHWTARFAPAARINASVNPAVDPISGQPELKHTPVRLRPAPMGWHGFLLARRSLGAGLAAWTALIPAAPRPLPPRARGHRAAGGRLRPPARPGRRTRRRLSPARGPRRRPPPRRATARGSPPRLPLPGARPLRAAAPRLAPLPLCRARHRQRRPPRPARRRPGRRPRPLAHHLRLPRHRRIQHLRSHRLRC